MSEERRSCESLQNCKASQIAVDQNYAPAIVDSHDTEGQDRDEDPNMGLREK